MIITATMYDSRRATTRWVGHAEFSDEYAGKWQQMKDRSCALTVEVLHNQAEGKLSVCIEDTEVDDDYVTRVIDNEPEHPEKMIALLESLIGSFDPAEHEEWREQLLHEAPGDEVDRDE